MCEIKLILYKSQSFTSKQCKTRTGDPEIRGPALVCLSAIDKKSLNINFSKHSSVLVFLMGQHPNCSGHNQRLFISKISDIIKETPTRQVKIYLQRVFLPPPSPMLANIHSILAYNVTRTRKFRRPLLVHCTVFSDQITQYIGSMLM